MSDGLCCTVDTLLDPENRLHMSAEDQLKELLDKLDVVTSMRSSGARTRRIRLLRKEINNVRYRRNSHLSNGDVKEEDEDEDEDEEDKEMDTENNLSSSSDKGKKIRYFSKTCSKPYARPLMFICTICIKFYIILCHHQAYHC